MDDDEYQGTQAPAREDAYAPPPGHQRPEPPAEYEFDDWALI